MRFGPRSRISPVSPAWAAPPPGPAIRTWKPAAARPDVRATVSAASPGRHIVATTASVRP